MRLWAVLFGILISGCGNDGGRQTESLRVRVTAAPTVTRPVTRPLVRPALTTEVLAQIVFLKAIIQADLRSRPVRAAQPEPAFVSNSIHQLHRAHRDGLRRSGIDPPDQLGLVSDGPYGRRQWGDETAYVWPDLVAPGADDPMPELLSFSGRARLRTLVGEVELTGIGPGQGYPGAHTAIAKDGRWLYFPHQAETDTIGDGDG